MEDGQYRPCVGIMLLNKKGEVFVGQRIDRYSDAWQMPQGGIDEGETPEEAAWRELEEETGIPSRFISLITESKDWISYDLPPDLRKEFWDGRYIGQTQKWFLMCFEGADDVVNINTATPEFRDWKWMSKEALSSNIVPFKRKTYDQVVAEFSPQILSFAKSSLG